MSPSIRTPILVGLLWSAFLFAIPPAANAGVILQAPTYVGLNSGLVGYWSFDGQDVAGETAYDRSGNGNDGTLTSGPARAAGKIGQALQFDGADDLVSMGDALDVSTQDFTYVLWLKLNSRDAYDGLITKGPFQPQFVLGGASGFSLHRAGNDNIFDNQGTTEFGVWTHIAVVRESTTYMLYQGGTRIYQTTFGPDFLPNSDDLVFGHDSLVAIGERHIDGAIDDVRIYNRALTADEIKRLYKIGGTFTTKAPTNNGLVGYWRLDEGSGTLAQDSSVSRNDGSLQGGPTWTNGRVGKALEFDGSDDYVNVPDSALLQLSTWAISAWIFPTRRSGYDMILTKTTGTGGLKNNYEMRLEDPTATFVLVGDSGAICTSNYVPPLNTWTHVSGTFDGTTVRVYVNGTVVNSCTGVTYTADNTPLKIGARDDLNSSMFFDGRIDEGRVYNRALSAEEIRNLYESSKQVFVNASQRNQLTNGLVGYWTFDGQDVAGVTAYDRSGQGNNGILTNGPARVAGKIGQALSLDGNDDKVNVPDSSSFDMASFTLVAWIKTSGAGSARRRVISQQNQGNTEYWFIGLYDDVLEFGSSKDVILTTKGTAINDNNWHHIAVIRNAGQFAYWYVNGVLVGSQAITDATTYAIDGSSVCIGCFQPLSTAEVFRGLIDDPRIYNRALSPDEIKRLYNMGR